MLESKLESMPDPLLDKALEWQMRLHSGQALAQERSAYAAWKLADPRHRAAARQAEQLWQDIGVAGTPLAAAPRRHLRAWAMAAGLALAAIGGVIGSGSRDAWLSDHHTGVGQPQTVTLDDGSMLELDAATAVDIDFSRERRYIRVRSGQIHLTVAADAARPFDVEAAGGTTRALGTAFNVQLDRDRVEVTVTEHAVRVSHAPPAGESVEVQSGQRLSYRAQGSFSSPVPAAIEVATAWRRGYLMFDGTPLADVVARIGRYRRGLILIRGEALEALPLTGVFKAADTDALLDALPQTLPVRVRRLPGLVLIEPNAG